MLLDGRLEHKFLIASSLACSGFRGSGREAVLGGYIGGRSAVHASEESAPAGPELLFPRLSLFWKFPVQGIISTCALDWLQIAGLQD